jgi:hypothetical protein
LESHGFPVLRLSWRIPRTDRRCVVCLPCVLGSHSKTYLPSRLCDTHTRPWDVALFLLVCW